MPTEGACSHTIEPCFALMLPELCGTPHVFVRCMHAVTGADANECHIMEDAEQSSRSGDRRSEQDCPEFCSDAASQCPMDQAPCSPRKPSQYTPAGFCGFWASIWPRADNARPSKDELVGRLPGQDGSRPVRCTLDSNTGVQYACPLIQECINFSFDTLVMAIFTSMI